MLWLLSRQSRVEVRYGVVAGKSGKSNPAEPCHALYSGRAVDKLGLAVESTGVTVAIEFQSADIPSLVDSLAFAGPHPATRCIVKMYCLQSMSIGQLYFVSRLY